MLSFLTGSTAFIAFLLVQQLSAQTDKYRLIEQWMNYSDAQAHCRSLYGTDLASIHSDDDNNAAKLLCMPTNTSCWIGLNAIRQEGAFEWEDGTVFDYGSNVSGGVYPWYQTQPDNWEQAEDCVGIGTWSDYRWNDGLCSNTRLIICKAPMTAALTTSKQPTVSPSTTTPTMTPTTASPSTEPTTASPSATMASTHEPSTSSSTPPPVTVSTAAQTTTTTTTLVTSTVAETTAASPSSAATTSSTPTQTIMIIAACASALFIAAVCICAAAFYFVRKNEVREDRRLSENVAEAQLEDEEQQVRVPPGVVAYARENAHVDDTRGEDNLSLPAQESVLCVDARRLKNIELTIAEVRVPPRVVPHARENAHVEDTRGEDNLSLPAQESVLCVEEGIAAHIPGRRQSQQQRHGGDTATLQTAVPTSGATAGIDPRLGVYELNLMVDL